MGGVLQAHLLKRKNTAQLLLHLTGGHKKFLFHFLLSVAFAEGRKESRWTLSVVGEGT